MLLALYSIHTQGSQYSCGAIQLCCSRHERAVSARGGHRQDLQQDRWRPRLVERRGQRQGNKASKWSEIKLQILQYKQYKFTLFPFFIQIGWFPSTYVDEEGVQWNSGVKDHPIKSTAPGEDSMISMATYHGSLFRWKHILQWILVLLSPFVMYESAFFPFLGISVWFLWRKLLRVCSFSAVGGGNWTEQNLPWSGQRTSMALSLDRNTCKVR